MSPICNQAADLLVEALGGPEWALKIAGGTKWWKFRTHAGVPAEWIGIKKDFRNEEQRRKKESRDGTSKTGHRAPTAKSHDNLRQASQHTQQTTSTPDSTGSNTSTPSLSDDGVSGEFTPEMDTLRCMLFIHGGAGYWGSIDTHRAIIWRYARQMRGRCFAVKYRLAPQFPWPCALQDSLAAYLYLIRPPENAKHRPVDPKNLIIAGDSAGGNLTLA